MNILGKKKSHKKDPHPSPLTPPSMESDDIDPTSVIFHQTLPLAARRSDHIWGAVPSPVRLAVDWLNKKGLAEEGLYRVPGKATTFATYKALFDRGVEFDFFELHEMAPENVAMVLIKYLQALPDPIYSSKFEAHFKLALGIANDQERATVMRGIMYMIPLAYRETCRVLVDHLRLVAANSEVNKMTIRNVELTWSLSVGQMTGAIVRVLSESPFPVPSTLQFHVPLEVAIENTPREMTSEKHLVPYAVSKLVSYMKENDAFSTPFLFSTEPKSADILEDVIYVLNGGSLGVDGAFPAEMSVIYAASALKQWISDVPGDSGLFPDAMRPDFVRVIPPGGPEAKSINYAQMPDKLEPLVWKLPDAHLETLKMLLGMLRTWTTFAPEDMTCLQAVELLFPGYPLPLQHVLSYLLHNFDTLFGEDDSALAAHLHSLVFASPGAASNPNGPNFASPLSPRHLAFNNKTSSGTPISSPGGPGTNGSSIAHLSGDASFHDPTLATGHITDEDDLDHEDIAGETTTAEATAEAPGTPTTPSKPYKKSKTLKAGSSPLAPGKVKKIKEAEDGTPTKKTKTTKPKANASDSPTRSASADLEDKPKPKHSKATSADAESPAASEKKKVPKNRTSDVSTPTDTPIRSASTEFGSGSADVLQKPEIFEKKEKSDTSEPNASASSSRQSKRRSKEPIPEEDAKSTPNGKEKKTKDSAPKTPPQDDTTDSVAKKDSEAKLNDTPGPASDKTKGTPKRNKGNSTASPEASSTAESKESSSGKKKKPVEEVSGSDSGVGDAGVIKSPSKGFLQAPESTTDRSQSKESASEGSSSSKSERNGKKKEKRSSKLPEEIEQVPSPVKTDSDEVDKLTPGKTKKRRSASATNGSAEKKNRNKSTSDNAGSTEDDPPQDAVRSSPSSSKRPKGAASEESSELNPPKQSRIKVTTNASTTSASESN